MEAEIRKQIAGSLENARQAEEVESQTQPAVEAGEGPADEQAVEAPAATEEAVQVGEAFLHGGLNQGDLRFQTRGLRLDGRFDGRELLGSRATHRRHGLPDQFQGRLVAGETLGK